MFERGHKHSPTPFTCCPDPGYFGEIHYEHQAAVEHWIGGTQDIAVCPNCQKPMLLLMSLDCRDPRLELTDFPLDHLPLMFCWTCTQAEMAYSFDESGSFTLLNYDKFPLDPDFPYEKYPQSFEAHPLRLIPIPLDVQRAIKAANEGTEDDWAALAAHLKLDIPTHQIGGMPYLIQHNVEECCPCPKCGKHAPFLASVGNDAGHQKSGVRAQFHGDDFVQMVFHFCRACRVVLASQTCD